MEAINREDGYYWVQPLGELSPWEVARWYKMRHAWMVSGNDIEHEDHDFEKINETKLTPPTNKL